MRAAQEFSSRTFDSIKMVSTMKKSIFDEQTNKALRKLQKNAQKKNKHHDVVRAEWANHVIQF
ncbi:hypothetical protein RchiOBHm_Chr2g0167941 [Rosa chinensis]|uniref:Uncharacterized protein n=1 Tax=Rosa chinensis TaxID=74649 RepID=A0A2P6S4I2_ROSCH|nr:hypothetical protein RchiOBHm_Chr2g0167941 [Rosa chinensis]